ncbi:Cbp1 family collagen-binding glycoprotein adhesin [Prevotella sp.]|uniref:Cbp1 family collagen-binding glycoprotein adhesin n=1 Tax=Prevotella sp. TaxID=59823 RepID=UPI0030778F6A
MKKILFVMCCMATIVACKNSKTPEPQQNIVQNDSLQKIIEQRDNEINDMMGILNDVEEGFRAISKAEDRVTIAKDGEGADKQEQIRENIQFIQQRMEHNRSLIAKLQQQMRESSFKSEELKRTVSNLIKQLEEKDDQLKQLRAELAAKDIHIAELDQTISNLNTNVSDLKTESEQKTQTIDSQDKQLNTAWFAFGTKKELKSQNILVKGKVLQGNFNKSYFTKIDICVDKEIKLYSKSAKLLTMHPSSSYTLTTDAKDQYVLRITNPQIFWSTSKYLVIQVK